MGVFKFKIAAWSSPSSKMVKSSWTESNEDTVIDTYRSLEEKVNLLNVEIIATKSFIEDQMLILRQWRKDSTLQKSPCDHNSEIARLTEETSYLSNENRTKSCIIETLLENDDTQKKRTKSGFKATIKYLQTLRII